MGRPLPRMVEPDRPGTEIERTGERLEYHFLLSEQPLDRDGDLPRVTLHHHEGPRAARGTLGDLQQRGTGDAPGAAPRRAAAGAARGWW